MKSGEIRTLLFIRQPPAGEWHLHTSWFDRSAMADLLDDNFRIAAKDTLYRCHDRLLEHEKALFTHLKERWAGLFEAHIFICFLAYCLHVTLERYNKRAAAGLSSRT